MKKGILLFAVFIFTMTCFTGCCDPCGDQACANNAKNIYDIEKKCGTSTDACSGIIYNNKGEGSPYVCIKVKNYGDCKITISYKDHNDEDIEVVVDTNQACGITLPPDKVLEFECDNVTGGKCLADWEYKVK